MAARKPKAQRVKVEATPAQPPPALAAAAFVKTREQTPVIPISGWDAGAIMDALEAHDMGQWRTPELLYWAMRKVDRIFGALGSRCNAIRQFPFSLCTPEGAPDRLAAAVKTLDQAWSDVVLSEADRGEVIERVVVFGFAVCRVQWTYRDGLRVPCLQPWSQGSMYYDWAQRIFKLTDEAGKVHDVPLSGVPGEWVVFHLGGSTPWLKGAIRPLSRLFAYIAQTYDRWSHYNDNQAEAIRVVKTPALKREQGEVQALVETTSGLRGGDTFLAPEGFGLDLVESKATGYKTFPDFLREQTAGVSIILLGHSSAQSNDGATGTYGSLQAALEVARDLSVTDVTVLATALAPLLRVWVLVNFDTRLYATVKPLQHYAPRACWDTALPEDKAAAAEVCSKTASAVAQLASAAGGMDALVRAGLDLKATLERCGLPLIKA